MASFRPPVSTNLQTHRPGALSTPIAPVGQSLVAARRRIAAPFASLWLSGLLLVGGMLAGASLVMAWQTRATAEASAASPVMSKSDRELVASTLSTMQNDQAALKADIAGLQSQLSQNQAAQNRSSAALQSTQAQMANAQLAVGTVAVRGQGITASFDDSTARSIPEGEDPANYILHEYDLRDMVNALWIAGAEAISINGERVVSTTSIYCVGTTILVNSTRLSPPFEIHAVGNPQALSAALKGSPQMEKFNQRAAIYDLPNKVGESTSVEVPAAKGSLDFKYAQPSGQK